MLTSAPARIASFQQLAENHLNTTQAPNSGLREKLSRRRIKKQKKGKIIYMGSDLSIVAPNQEIYKSFGNFLIKQVANTLKRELPKLNQFQTLSPLPGLMKWRENHAPMTFERCIEKNCSDDELLKQLYLSYRRRSSQAWDLSS